MESNHRPKPKNKNRENYENKENLDPLVQSTGKKIKESVPNSNIIIIDGNNNNNIQSNIQSNIVKKEKEKEDRIENNYKLLRKKNPREEDTEILKDVTHLNNVINNAKRVFAFSIENSKYSFHADTSSLKFRDNIKELLKSKPERKLRLNIIKSHAKLFAINKSFVITDRGIDCSQKTHNTHYISIGRQQVNDQGVRPNDIMLFPTDPSVSRSHFRIFHHEYFERHKAYDNSCLSMLKLTYPKYCPDFRYNKVNQLDVLNILKYNQPVSKVAIEDVGTIYGTYVKVKPFTFGAFFENFLLTMKQMARCSDHDGNSFLSNFPFLTTIDNFYQNDYTSLAYQIKEAFESIYLKRVSVSQSFHDKFSFEVEYDKSTYTTYSNFLHRYCPHPKSDKEIINENNFVIENYLPAVFLNNTKAGFNVIQTGNIFDIVEALKGEYLAFNGENFLPSIELISLDKLFDCQKLEPSSQMFKASITKQDLVCFYQTHPKLDDYSVLLFIETEGEVCGIMNRKSDVLFFANKLNATENKRAFSFNFIKGYLIGSNPNSAFHMNSEVDSFIYFNSSIDRWMLTDLTKFLNPSVYYSEEYHGLWVCISPDKKWSNRFTSRIYYIKSDDEIKISETIMKITIEDN